MDIETFFAAELDQHEETLKATRAIAPAFAKLARTCVESLRNGGKILFFGNGGSAADAQHLATELTIRYMKNRRALAAIALTTDSSALTAAANDFSFEEIFSRQVEALGRKGDVALGITTSGNSPNVLRALGQAKSMGLIAAALAGRDGGKLVGLADPLVIVPSNQTQRIQEMHITLGHMLCDILERELG